MTLEALKQEVATLDPQSRTELSTYLDSLHHPEVALAIEHAPGVCGGSARIGKTRIPVWSLEEARREGSTLDELLQAYPQLTSAHIELAWAYAREHSVEIEADIYSNNEGLEEVMRGEAVPGVQ